MQGMALIGAALHFGYSDMMEMYTSDFMGFVKLANELVEKQQQIR
ncbi:hypothetical protein ACOTV5_02340 [Aliarcobacter butzleri]